jgi:hypothetical protein
MLTRFLQEGHSTVVFSSGMIRKLGIATGFQQNAQVATLSSRGESHALHCSKRPAASCGRVAASLSAKRP